ncbi:MAG TPA: hypothetical protein VGJ08_01745 [Rhizomicrobium sp.]|jgi:hypothetical protein
MDRTSKAILIAIAAGLWMHAAIAILKPVPVSADENQLNSIAQNVQLIAGGLCLNRKICGP